MYKFRRFMGVRKYEKLKNWLLLVVLNFEIILNANNSQK